MTEDELLDKLATLLDAGPKICDCVWLHDQPRPIAVCYDHLLRIVVPLAVARLRELECIAADERALGNQITIVARERDEENADLHAEIERLEKQNGALREVMHRASRAWDEYGEDASEYRTCSRAIRELSEELSKWGE